MTQYFFSDLYFNLLLPGLSSTTWTWAGLEKLSRNGVVTILDWELDIASKVAKETRFVKDEVLSKKLGFPYGQYVYTGKESQLK